MIQIRNLAGVGFEEIHIAFTDAFSDYTVPLSLTCEELQYMLERRGYVPELSFGAFDNGEMVGFILNGIDAWNGIKTAYDTGTGVVKEFRRKGLATMIFEGSLPFLKGNNVRQYLLEVITTNEKAVELYRKSGFSTTRQFDYYVFSVDEVAGKLDTPNQSFRIEEINTPDWPLLQSFWGFPPSWQNSIASVNRKWDNFKLFEVFEGDVLAGHGIIEPHTGDIPQFAIAAPYRRKGMGTHLFHHLMKHSETGRIKMINVQADDIGFSQFMESMGLKPGGGQFEMLMKV